MNSNHLHYSGCQKNVPFDKRFFVTTTYAPSFIAEHFYGKGYNLLMCYDPSSSSHRNPAGLF